MIGKLKLKPGRIRSYTILISLILHLLIFFIFSLTSKLQIPSNGLEKKTPEERLVFELVETPRDVEQEMPEAEPDFASDKSTKASDPAENDLPEDNKPYHADIADFVQTPKPQQENEQQEETIQNETSRILSELQNKQKSFLETFEAQKQMQDLSQDNADYENLLSDVKNRGGMSLNTYQWEFAPYLLEMKRKVQSHNNPPFAFTHLGAVSGDVLLRFKVLQDGSVQDLEILNSTAHYSLENTSTRAIQFSAPFKPLPENFPNEYLEITALFSYILRK